MSKQREQDKPAKNPSAPPEKNDAPPKKRKPEAEDDLYDQGDIATPRRDPPYEDGI